MHAFLDAIRRFGIHSVRILPAKALFRVGGPEIMHAVRFLPWGISSRGPCTVCAAAISLEHQANQGHQVSMSARRNVTAVRTRAPDGSGARWAWVPSETRASGETLLALGSSLDEPPFRTACLALWAQDVAGRGPEPPLWNRGRR